MLIHCIKRLFGTGVTGTCVFDIFNHEGLDGGKIFDAMMKEKDLRAKNIVLPSISSMTT
jgi:hypothetical protein